MPTLKMTDDEARLLASWLRISAAWCDAEAERLQTVQRESHRFQIAQAQRIRDLCDRLERRASTADPAATLRP